MGRGTSKAGKGGGGGKNQAEKLSGYDINNSNLPAMQGTEKQVVWANDIRNQWIDAQNKQINLWSETAPSLMAARTKATEAAKKAGITYRDGEGSDVYKAAFEKEMKSKGFKGSYNEYQNALESYTNGTAITDTFPKPIQQKALKNLGMKYSPKTKDVKARVALYSEAAKLYLKSENRAARWIDLKDVTTRRIVYRNGRFEPL